MSANEVFQKYLEVTNEKKLDQAKLTELHSAMADHIRNGNEPDWAAFGKKRNEFFVYFQD